MTTTSRPSKGRAVKPHKNFPLFAHQRGYWAKKVRGEMKYFGRIDVDPKGEAALALWLEQRDELLASREPRSKQQDGLTVRELCNHFLTHKQSRADAGHISPGRGKPT